MQTVIYLLGGLIGLYLLFTLICTYFVQQLPRKPVSDPPDWGRVIDTKIPAVDGGSSRTPGYGDTVKSFLDRHLMNC